MKTVSFFILLLCVFSLVAAGNEQVKFVFQYNTQGERTPLTDDPKFSITKNDYKQAPDQLTLVGLRNAYSQGDKFKDLYSFQHPGFLLPYYEPKEYFIRSFPDNPSVMSAYAFILGTHPTQAEGLGLIKEKDATPPLRDAHVDDTRRALYLDRPVDGAKPVYIHTGNSDGFFFKDIPKMYPGLKRDFDKNLEDASQEYEDKHGNKFYYKLSSLMNVNLSELNFQSVAQYLDDYVSAYANGKPVTPFEFDNDALDMVTEYYTFLIKHGLLRDPALNKVLAHPFLYSLLREVLFKAQDDSEINRWEGPCVTSKVSLAFGNRLTYLAVLRVLNLDQDLVYTPGWGDQLTFELVQTNGKWYIRIFNNQDMVKLGTSDGNIPLDQFKEYIWNRLYYGNMDAVEAGYEDYHEMANIRGGKCDTLASVVPLFGCKKKPEYAFSQSTQNEYGWTQAELRKNENMRRYGGRSPVDDSVFFIKARQNSGSSYSWSSGSSGTPQNTGNSGSSYSWSSGNSGANQNTGNSGNSYSWSSGSSQPPTSSWSSSSGQNQNSYKSNNQGSQGNSATFSSSDNTPTYKQTSYVAGVDNCPLEYVHQGFQEIARTEIDVPTIVKKPVTTYVDEEVCKTVSIPTYKKEFNLFRVAPIRINQHENPGDAGYYRAGYSRDEGYVENEYEYTIEEPLIKYTDNPYIAESYRYNYPDNHVDYVAGPDFQSGSSSSSGSGYSSGGSNYYSGGSTGSNSGSSSSTGSHRYGDSPSYSGNYNSGVDYNSGDKKFPYYYDEVNHKRRR